MLVEIKQSSAP